MIFVDFRWFSKGIGSTRFLYFIGCSLIFFDFRRAAEPPNSGAFSPNVLRMINFVLRTINFVHLIPRLYVRLMFERISQMFTAFRRWSQMFDSYFDRWSIDSATIFCNMKRILLVICPSFCYMKPIMVPFCYLF